MNDLTNIKKKLIPVLKRHGVLKAGVFGSYARGENRKGSDVDMLVRLKRGKGYFDLIDLEDDLCKSTHLKIDLLTYGSINHLLKDRILKEEVRII